MMMIIKRNGTKVPFDSTKIFQAVAKANDACVTEKMTETQIRVIEEKVTKRVTEMSREPQIEEIQDIVVEEIQKQLAFECARRYIEFRYKRSLARKLDATDESILALVAGKNEELAKENANKNAILNSTQRDYIAGEESKKIVMQLLPADIVEAHKEGRIHFHDMDYALQKMHNCDLVNIKDMLANGTCISETKIETPKSFSTTANLVTQIIAQVASNQYGGQTVSLAHLAPYIDVSRKKHQKQVREDLLEAGLPFTDEQIVTIAESRLKREVKAGVQTIQYQLNTFHTTNGQTPFVSLMIYLGEAENEQEKKDLAMLAEEVFIQRMAGVPNKDGVFVTPAFPKLLYVLDEENTYEGSPYFWLTKIAARCTAKRMVPDYISAKIMRETKGDVYPCMGCRSFLTADRCSNEQGNIAGALDYNGKNKYYGRFNQGVVTMNLPFVALSSGKDMDIFWKKLEETLELCHRALQERHKHLKGTPSDVAPILWQHGALARLKSGETIDRLLYHGYSTISLGYAGLYECVKYMTGHSHTAEGGKPFALAVMQRLNDACNQWREEEDIDYSVYGTPLESTTYKFAKALQKNFGIVEGITDHNYVTNSYHVCVREEIDAFTKLSFEAEFQKLSPGGAISYVEVPNMETNIQGVVKIIQFIYENIMYAELNTKSDHCSICGTDGEMEIVDDGSFLSWKCPYCGNTDFSKMSVARRVCGYIGGSSGFNQGRLGDIRDRVLHVN